MMTDAHPDKIPATVVWSSPDLTARYTVQVISRNRPDSGRLGIIDRQTGVCIWEVQVGINRDADGAVTAEEIVSWAQRARGIISGKFISDDLFVPKRKRARA
ncbi:hypothetical protein [Deinococcus altitudinis]|uniref:hypothetical protein n=1 Tax=Deinococcus altitudinis TaxID=468914 RepID=UPI003892A5B8